RTARKKDVYRRRQSVVFAGYLLRQSTVVHSQSCVVENAKRSRSACPLILAASKLCLFHLPPSSRLREQHDRFWCQEIRDLQRAGDDPDYRLYPEIRHSSVPLVASLPAQAG